MEMLEVELLCIKYPCIQAHNHAKGSKANQILLTLCMALNHYEPEQLQHSLKQNINDEDHPQRIYKQLKENRIESKILEFILHNL